jgi:SAM-dependent methyltransferase
MDPHLRQNRDHWDELVGIHLKSKFYDVKAFRKGKIALDPLERAEVGDVAGKSLLHLQCHFGLATMSWARLGAEATGIDFSPQAITAARGLSAEMNLPTRFIECDVLEAPSHLDETFDVVFTSWGVLGWLPDLARWGEVVGQFVKPGGTFHLLEIHPTALMCEPNRKGLPVPHYSYFAQTNPLTFADETSYADGKRKIRNRKNHSWIFEMGQVVNALIAGGLHIDSLREYPFSCYRHFPDLVQRRDGFWHMPKRWPQMPLTFSIKARKPV